MSTKEAAKKLKKTKCNRKKTTKTQTKLSVYVFGRVHVVTYALHLIVRYSYSQIWSCFALSHQLWI